MVDASPASVSREVVVHVVDDDESFLRSVARLLRVSGFSVAVYSSGAAFLEFLQKDKCHGCVVTDLNMPDMDGIELQEAMHNAGCRLPIIFLSGKADIPDAVAAMQRGAEDFLTKDSPKENLVSAVKQAILHGEEIRGEEAEKCALHQRLNLLSKREKEVFYHVAKGKLNKQIAAELNIHLRTVKLHRSNLTRKLDVYSVAELTLLAKEFGVIP